MARLRYIDFDSEEMAEYPSVQRQVEEGDLQPGLIEIESQLLPMYTVSYQRMVDEFERLGAIRISSKAS
jgi:hypothetical protein